MPSYGTCRITEKEMRHLLILEREIQFRANKPYYIKAIACSHSCLTDKNKTASAATFCSNGGFGRRSIDVFAERAFGAIPQD